MDERVIEIDEEGPLGNSTRPPVRICLAAASDVAARRPHERFKCSEKGGRRPQGRCDDGMADAIDRVESDVARRKRRFRWAKPFDLRANYDSPDKNW